MRGLILSAAALALAGAHGRPVGVAVAGDGTLLVADDTGATISPVTAR